MRLNGIIAISAPAGPQRGQTRENYLMRLRIVFVAIVCAAWPAGLPAFQAGGGQSAPPPPPPAQQQPTPTFRTRIDSVSVDVTVTDKQGRPVTDLTAADFEIKEAGKVQTIDQFKLVSVDEADPRPPYRDITSLQDQAREAADERNRLFIIFLDDYHVRRQNSLRVRQQLARFVSGLTPRDLVAIIYPLTPMSAATFTRNHDGTAAAIMKFDGRKYDYTPKNLYEERYQNQPPELLERMRNDLTLSGLENACIFMGTLREGRKTILFVSEGLSGTLPSGVNTTGTPYLPGATPSQSQSFFSSTQLLSQMQDVFSSANRANTSLYTLDPRGLATGEFDIADKVAYEQDKMVLNESLDSLRILADQTDGRAIVNRNDPMPELNRMIRELSAYYLLGYTSSVAPRDGKFHPIQVRLKRQGLEIRARKGYWAYSPEEIEKASAPSKPGPPRDVSAALETMATIVEPGSRRTLNLWLGARRGPGEKAVVTLVWEANGTPADPSEAIDRVTIVAHSISGDTLHSGPVARDPALARPGGVVTFEAPAGAMQVRATAESARGHRLDSEEMTYSVPDFTATGPITSEPQVFRGRTAREIQDIRAAAAPVPTTARQFSRTERLLLRFDAYGPGGTTPALTMRLLNQMGDPIADLPAPTVSSGATFESSIPLGGLPPGDYIIEIVAKAADDTSKRLLAIRITG
jgi:VWFA-related protein